MRNEYEENMRNKYVKMIKRIFNGKYDEFEFGSNCYSFKFKQIIPQISDESEQYYAAIRYGTRVYMRIIYETKYYGKLLTGDCMEIVSRNICFWRENEKKLEEFKQIIDNYKKKKPYLNSKMNSIASSVIEEETGMKLKFSFFDNELQLNEDMRDYVLRNQKIKNLLKELNKEIKIYETIKKI